MKVENMKSRNGSMETMYKNYRIKSRYIGNKAAAWDGTNRNRHIVWVQNTETGAIIKFDFWGSIVKPVIKSAADLKDAFSCFLSDVLSGKMTFENFCLELGYDDDSRAAEKTWRDCQASAEKVDKIITGDIYELINELSDDINA